jgi:GNAT superfamily N-acetyltransferase
MSDIVIERQHREFIGDPPKRDILLIARKRLPDEAPFPMPSSEIAGVAELSSLETDFPNVYSVHVAPSHRRTGVGLAVIKECIEIARQQNKKALRIWVHPENVAAVALYKRCGFFFCAGDDKTSHMMVHPLGQSCGVAGFGWVVGPPPAVAEPIAKSIVSSDWKATAMDAVESVCRAVNEFTVDDVRHQLDILMKERSMVMPTEARIMGSVLADAEARKWCKATDRYRRTTQKQCHGNPRRVWASLITTTEAKCPT